MKRNTDSFETMLSALPPEDVVKHVTPWRRAIYFILTGLALGSVTLSFALLQYILPTVGLILRLLGFRVLRHENRAFRSGFICSILQTCLIIPVLILNSTIYSTEPYIAVFYRIATAVNIVFGFGNLLFVWLGFRQVQIKTGMEPNVSGALLLVWHCIVVILALLKYNGIIIGILMICIYFLLLRGLYRLSKEIESSGYSITPASVRINDSTIAILIAAILAAGLFTGYTFFSSYRMDWHSAEPSGNTEVEEVKAELIKLGFPQKILSDITDDDILACKGAEKVIVTDRYHPVNNGRQVTTNINNHIYIDTVFDEKELHITGITVKLSDGHIRLFHHFEWVLDVDFHGTEAIQLWTAYRNRNGWLPDSDITGQVLCDIDGETRISDYKSLEDLSYTSVSPIFGTSDENSVFGEFSFPRKSEHQRGYVSYAIRENIPGYIIDGWFNYVHQTRLLQYPAITSAQAQMKGFWNSLSDVFFLVQDAIQTYNDKPL